MVYSAKHLIKLLRNFAKTTYDDILAWFSIVCFIFVSIPLAALGSILFAALTYSGVLNILSETPIKCPKWLKWIGDKLEGLDDE